MKYTQIYMTVDEKTELYSFLSYAESWISGYSIKQPMPNFTLHDAEEKTIILCVETTHFDQNESELIEKMLSAIGVTLYEDCHILRIDQSIPSIYNSLQNAIAVHQPKAILCMGSAFCTGELGFPAALEECQEKIFSISGIPTILTYSPQLILNQLQLKRPVWENIKIFKSVLQS